MNDILEFSVSLFCSFSLCSTSFSLRQSLYNSQNAWKKQLEDQKELEYSITRLSKCKNPSTPNKAWGIQSIHWRFNYPSRRTITKVNYSFICNQGWHREGKSTNPKGSELVGWVGFKRILFIQELTSVRIDIRIGPKPYLQITSHRNGPLGLECYQSLIHLNVRKETSTIFFSFFHLCLLFRDIVVFCYITSFFHKNYILLWFYPDIISYKSIMYLC